MPTMLHVVTLLFALGFSLSAFAQVPTGSSIRMTRSLSGASGKVVGSKFVLDEIRNRFVYPQDNSLTVYFECRAPIGDYTLTAYWKDPKGVTAGISPDLKIKTVNNELNSYWIFMIDSGKEGGIWTVEIRVNGEPVGSHSFELAMPERAQPPAAVALPEPTLDEVYRSGIKSLVWVHKLNKTGQRIATSSGFVVAPEAVLTAFQSIDTASGIEIEFADGTKSITDVILACSRIQDWAIVKAETRDTPSLEIGKSNSVIVGEQAVVFSIGSGISRIIGAVDISGRGVVRGFGERIQINPQLPQMAIGGPLLDNFGKVVGVVGGSLSPGIGLDHPNIAIDMAISGSRIGMISVTPIEGISLQPPYQAATLQNLLESGILTPPLSKMPVFNFGTVTNKVEMNPSYVSRPQFSRKSSDIIVYTQWQGNEKIQKGVISMSIFDVNNRLRSKTEPQTLKLSPEKLIRFHYTFNAASIEAGLYRIDLLWDGVPVWREWISIID
jgi:S1-C subfamily serine protease